MTALAQPVFRFAPSPTGRLHLGHAYAALINFDLAKSLGARFLLRIEDIDPVRSTRANIDGIIDDLKWLGITWDGPILSQSRRFSAYRAAAEKLRADNLLYACAASRKELNTALSMSPDRDPDGAPLYRPICRLVDGCQLAKPGEPVALRLDMSRALDGSVAPLTITSWHGDIDKEKSTVGATTYSERVATPEIWGDVVLVRKDTPASYHLAAVVDDAFQGVTHVVRGADLERATDLHRLLQSLLGLPTAIYHHHHLITDDAGRKLAKSARDTSLQQLRLDGATPTDIRAMVGL
ncbi:MAG: tRNA glutamyl-Q(34) synthetase GluQRS [Pseudomonadota bacterium]